MNAAAAEERLRGDEHAVQGRIGMGHGRHELQLAGAGIFLGEVEHQGTGFGHGARPPGRAGRRVHQGVGQERAAHSAPHDEVATSQDTAAVAWTRALRRDEDGPAFSDSRCMRLRFV